MNQKQYVQALNESKARNDALKYVVKSQERVLDWLFDNVLVEQQMDMVPPIDVMPQPPGEAKTLKELLR